MDSVRSLWLDQHRSYRSLPAWVQGWVAWLVTVNVAGGLDRSTPTGRAVARANAVFLIPNTVIVVAQRGYSSALSFTHLVAWPSLVVTLTRRATSSEASQRERVTAALVGLTNAVSLAFDVVDAARWLRGDRAVAGAQDR